MAVTNYYSIGGEVIAERTAGSARVDYLTDALGSITATVNQSAQVVNTYRYKPAGSQLAKTGIGADPKFGWAGYLPTQKRFSEHYLRGRHVSDLIGVFTTKDQFIAAVSPYAYALNNPVLFTDPMGWAPCQGQAPPPQPKLAPVTPAPAPAPKPPQPNLCDYQNPPPGRLISAQWCKQCMLPQCTDGYASWRCDNGDTDCNVCGTGQKSIMLCGGKVKVNCKPCPAGSAPGPTPPKAGSPSPGAGGQPAGGITACTRAEQIDCWARQPGRMSACKFLARESEATCCGRICPPNKNTVIPTLPKGKTLLNP